MFHAQNYYLDTFKEEAARIGEYIGKQAPKVTQPTR
jgi:hypothetical protein